MREIAVECMARGQIKSGAEEMLIKILMKDLQGWDPAMCLQAIEEYRLRKPYFPSISDLHDRLFELKEVKADRLAALQRERRLWQDQIDNASPDRAEALRQVAEARGVFRHRPELEGPEETRQLEDKS